MKSRRIQRTRAKGARLPENTVCVTRPGKWGNPFPVTETRTQADSVRSFETALCNGELAFTVGDVRRELAGKNLACWCNPGTPCHGDVLLRLANDSEPLPVEMLLTDAKRRITIQEHADFRKSLATQPEGDEL